MPVHSRIAARRAIAAFITIAPIAASITMAACRSNGAAPDPAAADVASATKETEDWRAEHEGSYRTNWVTIAGLHFLEPGSHTAGTASTNDIVLPPSAAVPHIGRFVLAGDVVRFEPDPKSGVQINGQPITMPRELADDTATTADSIEVRGIRMVVHRSGDRRSLRVWDPEGEMARGFLGFKWFPIQMAFRVTGRFIPDATPRDLQVMNTFGDLDTYKTEGVVEFTLQGRTLRLRPFTTRPKRFYIVFKDESSGAETYEAARFLYADLRDDGTAVLDFNQAYNPPCAFNPYTTCPIPLPENRLPVKVLAGEQAYPVHVTAPKS
jgi:uncharacterized protein (DUF1684 family)